MQVKLKVRATKTEFQRTFQRMIFLPISVFFKAILGGKITPNFYRTTPKYLANGRIVNRMVQQDKTIKHSWLLAQLMHPMSAGLGNLWIVQPLETILCPTTRYQPEDLQLHLYLIRTVHTMKKIQETLVCLQIQGGKRLNENNFPDFSRILIHFPGLFEHWFLMFTTA